MSDSLAMTRLRWCWLIGMSAEASSYASGFNVEAIPTLFRIWDIESSKTTFRLSKEFRCDDRDE